MVAYVTRKPASAMRIAPYGYSFGAQCNRPAVYSPNRPLAGGLFGHFGRVENEKWPLSRSIIALPVRLVTFDRKGHRRLGALVGAQVVDLPEAVGHPAFPSTME